MGELFDGWRKKVGVVTLLISFAVIGVWTRSTIDSNVLLVQFGGANHAFASMNGGFQWVHHSRNFKFPTPYWYSLPAPGNLGEIAMAGHDGIEWDWQWRRRACGFDFGHARENRFGATLSMWTIPYWSIVIPLTVISLWLLKSPGKSTSKNITEGVRDQGQ